MKVKRILLVLMIWFMTGIILSCSEDTTTLTTTSINMLNKYKIVFYSGRTGNNDIFIVDSDRSNLINLTDHSADDNAPAVSPDGTKIAFVSNRDGVPNIYIMTINGDSIQKVTDSTIETTHPSWSSDGTKLLYVVDFGNKTEIWQIDSNGQNSTRLTNNEYRDERPVFSPDMSKVLFMSNREGKYRIYVMDYLGEHQQKVSVEGVEDTNRHYIFPQFSPDGEKIIYSLNDSTNREAEIHICNIDGTDDTRLSEIGGRNENPSISSNGEWIVFQSERDGNFEIYIMNIDGTNAQRITNNTAWDGWPSWVNTNS